MEYQTVGMCNSFADCLTITLKYHCTMLHPTPLVHTCQVSVSKSHNSLGPAELAPPAKSPAPNCYAQLVRVMLHTTVYKRLCVRTYVIDWWMDGLMDDTTLRQWQSQRVTPSPSASFFLAASLFMRFLEKPGWKRPHRATVRVDPMLPCVAYCSTDQNTKTQTTAQNVWTCSTAVGSFEDDNGPKMEKHHRLGGKLCWVDSVLRFSFNIFNSLSLFV